MTPTDLIKLKNQSLVIEPDVMATDYTLEERCILSYVRLNKVVDFTDICLFLNIDMKTAAQACANLKLLMEDVVIGNTTKSMIFEESVYKNFLELTTNVDAVLKHKELTNENETINFNSSKELDETNEINAKEPTTETNRYNRGNNEEKDLYSSATLKVAPSPSLDEDVVNIEYTRLKLDNIDIKEQIKDLPKQELYDNNNLKSLRELTTDVDALKKLEDELTKDNLYLRNKDIIGDNTTMNKNTEYFICDRNGLRDEKTWKPQDANYVTPPEEKEYSFWDLNDDDNNLTTNVDGNLKVSWAKEDDVKVKDDNYYLDEYQKHINETVERERSIIEELETTRGINGKEIPIVKVEENDNPWACSQEEQEQWDRDIASLFNTEYDDIEAKHDAIIKETNSDVDRLNKDVALIDNDWNRWLAKVGYYAWIEPEGYEKQCSYNKYVYYSDYITAVKDKLNFYDATMYMICQINKVCDFKVGAIFDIFKPQELKQLKAIGKPVSQIIDDFKVYKTNCKTKAQAIESYRYLIRVACEARPSVK